MADLRCRSAKTMLGDRAIAIGAEKEFAGRAQTGELANRFIVRAAA